MPFLEILSPNGRRDKIEVTNNTPIIEVLEDVCAKYNLNTNCCLLMQGKRKVDLSLKFGSSNFVSNSKLELVVRDKSLVENTSLDVTLQLPNNSRLTNKFSPLKSLWNILEEFIKLNPGNELDIFPDKSSNFFPVILNLHDQIIGEYCLQNTTLAQLGLREGRALLKLNYKEMSEEDLNKQNMQLISRRQKLVDLGSKYSKKNESTGVHIGPIEQPHMVAPSTGNIPTNSNINETSPFSPFYTPRSIFDDKKHPNSTNYDPMNNKSQTLGEMMGISLDPDQNSRYPQQQPDFSNFRFPDTVVTQNEIVSNESDHLNVGLKMEERECVFFQRISRKLEDQNEELSESFFELTEQDMRLYIQRCHEQSEADTPLITNTLREKQRELRFNKYRRCIIQFQFPDAYILQSVFQPSELVSNLYDFINQFFDNNHKNKAIKFQLYTTPPKTLLSDRNMNLIKADLVPMSKVYVSVAANEIGHNKISQLLTSNAASKAQGIVEKWMNNISTVDAPSDQMCIDNVATSTSTVSAQHMTSTQRPISSFGTNYSKNVPKWFRTTK